MKEKSAGQLILKAEEEIRKVLMVLGKELYQKHDLAIIRCETVVYGVLDCYGESSVADVSIETRPAERD